MGFLPTIRQRVQSDLQYRLGLVAYVPILCLGVLATGGLVFLPGSTGVRIYGIFALLGVGVSALVAHRTIKSVLDSLDRVAGSARSLVSAQEALLDNDSAPIEAWPELDESADDELGLLASALNATHRNTLEIDRNQNESIRKGISNIVINLARRSQALLDRQVEYIDRLENTEEDPDRLEQMFKVDHLATRMRRNAESLLVLADADPGKRRGGPVDVADVLRVAMGEIENYQHIELSTVEPGRVTSAAAVDLAHMAAELMENATQFSPPDTPVEVSGRLVDGQYLISIVDHGMGMPDEQLAKANETLVNPPELGLAMGRSLGFVVIGRLADRVGAEVELGKTADSGVTARIAVPTSVFTEVGDNSGTRRSVLAPETAEAPAVGEEPAQSKSPALSKLLGLDASALAGGGTPDEQPDDADAGSPTSESAEAQETWTPPPVTPDAPIALPPEVAALAGAVPDDEPSWTPPAVSTDMASPPLTDRSVERDPPSDDSDGEPPAAAPTTSEVEGEPFEIPPARPELTVGEVQEASDTGDDEFEAWSSTDDETATAIESEAPETSAAAEALDAPEGLDSPEAMDAPEGSDVSEEFEASEELDAPEESEAHDDSEVSSTDSVETDRPPTNLEDALPTGRAFETGMASLLEEQTAESPTATDSGGETESSSEPDATSSGLTRRKRGQSKVPTGEGRPVAASARNPEEIRSMLSRYRDGIKGNKTPAETGEE